MNRFITRELWTAILRRQKGFIIKQSTKTRIDRIEKRLADRHELDQLFQLEWQKYRQAVSKNSPDEVESIYWGIEELKAQIITVNNDLRKLLATGD